MTSTTLTTANGYNTDNMIFSKPEEGNIPGSPLKFKRVRIGTKNPDGTTGDLIIKTEEVFSFGIQENTDMTTQKVNGHVMPLCLWNKNGATDEEKIWTTTFDKIVEKCKEYILDHKDDIERYDLDESDLKKLNPLYWKREKGKKVEGMGPTLYAKLIESKKTNSILTLFTDADTNEDINAMDFKRKYCYVQAAIKIESIFVGNKVSLQVKLYEGVIRQLSSGPTRLLRPNATRPVAVAPAKPEPTESVFDQAEGAGEGSDDEGSLGGSESGSGSESEGESPEPVKQQPVKRVIKKKVVRKKS